jgi:hypothetical protein
MAKADMLETCVLTVQQVTDLGVDKESITNLDVVKARFSAAERAKLPLDCVPYKTLSAAVGHCMLSGTLLESVLGTNATGSDTDISFG